jgi:hypothetical protein
MGVEALCPADCLLQQRFGILDISSRLRKRGFNRKDDLKKEQIRLEGMRELL